MPDITRIVNKKINLELFGEEMRVALPKVSISVGGYDRPVILASGERSFEYTVIPKARVTSVKSERGVRTEHVSQPGEIVFRSESDLTGQEIATLNRTLADHRSTGRTAGQLVLEQRVIDVAALRIVDADQSNIGQPELRQMLRVILSRN